MCCAFALLLALGPRITLVLLWIFNNNRFDRAFDTLGTPMSFIVPLLGFLFVPLTTLVYLFVAPNGVNGLDWIWLIIGLVIDLGAYGGGAWDRRRRRR